MVGAGSGNRNGGGGRGHGRGHDREGRGFGQGNGRGRDLTGRGRGGATVADGIDISDVTRSFSGQEWGALSSESQRHVHKERDWKCRRTDQGSPREVAPTVALEQATAVMANVTFEEPPDDDNGGAGRAAGFGRGAYRGRGRAGR
jgi:hypothetical protein